MCRILHPEIEKYILFFRIHGVIIKIEHVLGHHVSCNMYQGIKCHIGQNADYSVIFKSITRKKNKTSPSSKITH